MSLDAMKVLGWDPKDDPQSAVVQERRLAGVAELMGENEALRARIAELEAELATLKTPAKKATSAKAE